MASVAALAGMVPETLEHSDTMRESKGAESMVDIEKKIVETEKVNHRSV